MKARLQNVTAVIFVSLLLFGCKRGETPASEVQENKQADSANPSTPGHDLFKAQHDALDKAKAVGGQLQQQAEDQEKAIEAAQK